MPQSKSDFFLTTEDLKKIADDMEKGITSEFETGEESIMETIQSKKEFLRRLVHQTLKHAFENVPYYRKLAQQTGFKVESFKNLEDLEKIPPLENKLVRNDPSRFLAENMIERIVTMRRSSGTTSTPVRVYISRDEIDAAAYYSRIMKSYIQDDINHKNISLFVGNMNLILMHVLSEFTIVSEVDYLPGREFDKVIEDLLYEYKLPNFPNRISTVTVGTARVIRLLTKALIKKGIDPNSLGITKFVVLDSVSESTKKWIKETWNADVNCIFSLAECAGGAYQCEYGNYHYDICSYPEIIDVEKLNPAKEGEEGRLLLTTLYPFQQTMPLIRYVTGDIVIKGPDVCKCGEVGASFSKVLGKAKFCIYLGGLIKSENKRKWIGHYEVRDVLEEYPEYFIIEGYEAPIIKMVKEQKQHSLKIKMQFCINKRVKISEAEKKAEEAVNKVLTPWNHYLKSEKIKVITELIKVPPYSDPKSLGFFEQH